MLWRARVGVIAVVVAPLLSACNARAGELGTGEVVGCGDIDSAPKVDEVTIFSVQGVAISIAVITERGEWHGVYVAEDVPRSEWPRVLRNH